MPSQEEARFRQRRKVEELLCSPWPLSDLHCSTPFPKHPTSLGFKLTGYTSPPLLLSTSLSVTPHSLRTSSPQLLPLPWVTWTPPQTPPQTMAWPLAPRTSLSPMAPPLLQISCHNLSSPETALLQHQESELAFSSCTPLSSGSLAPTPCTGTVFTHTHVTGFSTSPVVQLPEALGLFSSPPMARHCHHDALSPCSPSASVTLTQLNQACRSSTPTSSVLVPTAGSAKEAHPGGQMASGVPSPARTR